MTFDPLKLLQQGGPLGFLAIIGFLVYQQAASGQIKSEQAITAYVALAAISAIYGAASAGREGTT